MQKQRLFNNVFFQKNFVLETDFFIVIFLNKKMIFEFQNRVARVKSTKIFFFYYVVIKSVSEKDNFDDKIVEEAVLHQLSQKNLHFTYEISSASFNRKPDFIIDTVNQTVLYNI